jgi:lipoate-protein ligase A
LELRDYTPAETEEITTLRDTKYATQEWNFGKSPKFRLTGKFKLPCGFFETFVDVKDGYITKCQILGDYFFIRPTSDICEALEGTQHSYSAIKERLSQFPLKEYFGEDILEELTKNLI